MSYKRETVIPHPGGDETSVLVVFKDDRGRLLNETIRLPGIAAQYGDHQRTLDALAEEYSAKREEIVKKRSAIDDQAFSVAESQIKKREDETKRRLEQERQENAETE